MGRVKAQRLVKSERWRIKQCVYLGNLRVREVTMENKKIRKDKQRKRENDMKRNKDINMK